MAKTQIKRLKERRFWRWLCVNVYGKPAPKDAIKKRPPRRLTRGEKKRIKRRVAVVMRRLQPLIEQHRAARAAERKDQ
jgi:hypothetical protein